MRYVLVLASAWFLTGGTTISLADYVRDRAVEGLLERVVDRYSIESISGSLSEPTLEGVVLETSGLKITAERIRVAWNPWRLALAEAHVDRLLVEGVSVEPGPVEAPSDAGAGEGFEMPIDLTISELALERCTISLGEEPIDIERLSLSIEAEGSDFRFRNVDVSSSMATATLDAQLQSIPPFAYSLSGVARSETGALAIAGSIRITGDQQALTADAALTAPGVAEAELALELGTPTPVARLGGGWEAMSLLDGPVSLGRGSVSAEGPVSALEVRAATVLLSPGLEAAEVSIAGLYTPEEFVLREVLLDWSGNRVTADGRIDIAARRFAAAVRTTDLHLSALLPESPVDLASRVSAAADVTGAMTERGIEVEFRRFDVQGFWNGRPLILDAAGRWTPDTLQIEKLALKVAENELTMQGAIGEESDLTFELEARALGDIWPGAEGVASARGRIAKLLPFSGEVASDLQGLGLGDLSLATATLELSGDGATSRARIRGTELATALGSVAAIALDADGRGTLQALNLSASSSYGELEAQIDLSLGVAQISGVLQALTLSEPLMGSWSLSAPVRFDRADGRTRIGQACLARDTASLCLDDADFPNEAPALAGTFARIPISQIAELALPDSPARFEGEVSGDFATGPSRQRLAVQHRGGSVTITDNGDMLVQSEIRSAELLLERTQSDDRLTFEIDLGDVGGLELHTEVRERAISGVAHGKLADLRYVGAFVSDISSFTGHAVVDVTVGGTLDAPSVDGTATLRATNLILRGAPVLRDVHLEARAEGQRKLALRGEASIGDGRIETNGEIELTAFNAIDGWLRVTGGPVPIIDLPDLNVFAVPDLTLTMSESEIGVSGTLEIPTASVRWTAVPSAESGLSDDVVIHRSESEESEMTTFATRMNVTVKLGENVTITGAGLDTRVVGALGLRSEPNRPPSLTGYLETVGGKYEAFGQELTISTGRLDFNGPLLNPGVDVKASRTIEEIEVGVELSGLFEQLQTRLYSSPPMEDAEILSYLLTGHGLDQTTDAQRDNLSNVALRLGLATPVSFLQRTTPIDEISVEDPLNQESSALMVGKALTPRLYVRYRYRIYQRTSGLILRYRLMRNLHVQSETGEVSAVDFLFTREFD
jgi:translocation and assembly module TamB